MDQSEDTLTDAENLKLLHNFPIEDSENEGCYKNDVIVMFGSYDEDLKETAKDTIVQKRRKRSSFRWRKQHRFHHITTW